MTDSRTKAFWIIAGLAFVWNLLGLSAFVAEMSITAEMISQMPQAEQALRAATPSWVNIAFGIAVIAGTMGSILLLMKKAVAHAVFWISLLAVIAQMGYVFLLSDALSIYGPESAIMPSMILVVAALLVWYSKRFS